MGDQASVNPQLGALQNNGDATATLLPSLASPAIGNGGPNCPSLDRDAPALVRLHERGGAGDGGIRRLLDDRL